MHCKTWMTDFLHICKPPAFVTPLFSRINQWACSFRELPCLAFSCLHYGLTTRSRCAKPQEGHLRKTQSHSHPLLTPKKESYVRIRHYLTPPPLIHPWLVILEITSKNCGDMLSRIVGLMLHCQFINQESHITIPPQEPSHHLVGCPQRDQWSSVLHLVCMETWRQNHTDILFISYHLDRNLHIITL